MLKLVVESDKSYLSLPGARESSKRMVTVDDPDDLFGNPIYEGPADRAADILIPGTYSADYTYDT